MHKNAMPENVNARSVGSYLINFRDGNLIFQKNVQWCLLIKSLFICAKGLMLDNFLSVVEEISAISAYIIQPRELLQLLRVRAKFHITADSRSAQIQKAGPVHFHTAAITVAA